MFLILVVLFAIILPVGLFAICHNYASEYHLLFRMWRRGRYLPWRQLSARIVEEESGTLIIEAPSRGWGFNRAWWTPENVKAICQLTEPTDGEYQHAIVNQQCLDWDRWIWENYINSNHGRGFLLRVWNGQSLEKSLKKTAPFVEIVKTWTAFVHTPKPETDPGTA